MKILNVMLVFLIFISGVFAGVEITPTSPNTDDDLFCRFNGVTSGFSFNWFINGVYANGGSVLDSSRTSVDDLVSCDAWMLMPGQDVYIGTDYARVINRDPVVYDIPDIFMDEDDIYSFDLSGYGIDPDSDVLTWGVSGNINVGIDIQGSIVTLTPVQDWFGVEAITFTARDRNGGADSDVIDVNVNNVDDVPVISDFNPATPVDVDEGSSRLFDVVVVDVDGDPITYEWYLDGNLVSTSATYAYNSIDGPDSHGLMVIVSDGITDVFNIWDVNDINVIPGVSIGNFNVDEGDTVIFNVGVNDPGVLDTFTFSFDFDDDGSYEILDQLSNTASFTFTDAGVYDVNIMVRDDDGGSGFGVSNVVVNNVAPVANAGGPYLCQIGTSITLIGSNDGYAGDAVQYQWDLDGDGVFDDSVLQNPVYNCNVLGSFNIGLRVTDDENSFSVSLTSVDVVDYPVNNAPVFSPGLVDQTAIVGQLFTYDIDAVDPDGDAVAFSDDTVLFDIDVNTGLIVFTPSATGLSTITITVCDDYVPIACTSDSFDLDVQPVPNTSPAVALTSPSNGDIYLSGGNVFFDASATDLEDGDINGLVVWSSSIDGVFGTGVGFNYNGLSVGTHIITASVTDSGGLSDSDSVTIDINLGVTECNDGSDNDGDGLIDLVDDGCLSSNDLSEQENPVALFTASSINVKENDVVGFDASSSDDIDGVIVSYDWDFGDGNTDSGVSVSHSYAQDGVYTIVLTVTDNDGLTDTNSVDITVSDLVGSVTGASGGGEAGRVKHDLRIENLKVVNDVVIFDVVNGGNVKEDVNIDVIFRESGVVDSLGRFVLNKGTSRTFSNDLVDYGGDITIDVHVYNSQNDVSEGIVYSAGDDVFIDETGFVALDNQAIESKESNIVLVMWGLLVLLMLVLIILALTYIF